MRPVLILYAKAPVPGRVKTRLAERWGAEKAAELHAAFARDTLEMLSRFADSADVELHTDVATDAWPDFAIPRELQAPGDLAAKLLATFTQGLSAGRPRVIVVGSDSPTLPPSYLRHLLDSSADVALGPCEDGGYYAIACGRASPGMFAGVEWSTPRTLEQTERAVQACGLTVERGQIWYDIDNPEDLSRVRAELDVPVYTRRALAAL
jgi:rSAM/selenodomain-associated transferase 1